MWPAEVEAPKHRPSSPFGEGCTVDDRAGPAHLMPAVENNTCTQRRVGAWGEGSEGEDAESGQRQEVRIRAD